MYFILHNLIITFCVKNIYRNLVIEILYWFSTLQLCVATTVSKAAYQEKQSGFSFPSAGTKHRDPCFPSDVAPHQWRSYGRPGSA